MGRSSKIALTIALLGGLQPAWSQTGISSIELKEIPSGGGTSLASRWPEVTLNFVIDKKGGGTLPIRESSLQLLEDSAHQKIDSISGPGSPVSLCLQIDISGSMARQIEMVRDAATALISNLPPGSEVMVSVFANRTFLAAPFTPVRDFDLSIFGRLKYGHRSALDDSIVMTENYFVRFARFPRRALVLITDGSDNNSRHGLRDVEHAMEMPGDPFAYVLEILHPASQLLPGSEPIGIFLSSVRAFVVNLLDTDDVRNGAVAIASCIDAQYALTYRSQLSTADKRLHKINIEFKEPDPKITIVALPGFYAPGP